MANVILKSGGMSVAFSRAAAENIEEIDLDWTQDLVDLKQGITTPDSLLQECLDGASEDRVQGWREYVADLARAAKPPLRAEVEGDFRKAWDVSGFGNRG